MTEFSSVSGLRGVRERIEAMRDNERRMAKDCADKRSRQYNFYMCYVDAYNRVLELLAALSLPPSPQPTNVEFQAGDEVWVRGEISEAIEDGDKDWVEAIFDSATGHIFVSMRPKDVRSSPAGAQGQVQGVQARVEAKIKQWRECPCGGPCDEFADDLAEVLK